MQGNKCGREKFKVQKKCIKQHKNIVKNEYNKFLIHLKFVALYKLWSKTYKMFWWWSHQNLQVANGLLRKLLYLVRPIVLSVFMCLCSCLSAKYLWKVLKTTSSLKWVWNGWNFARSNCIQGGRLLQCCWNLHVMLIVCPT